MATIYSQYNNKPMNFPVASAAELTSGFPVERYIKRGSAVIDIVNRALLSR